MPPDSHLSGASSSGGSSPGWVGGAFLGLAAISVQWFPWTLLTGELRGDSAVVPLMWFTFMAVSALFEGGFAGMVLGAVVMFAVGRDPQVRAARRPPATIAFLIAPFVLWAVFYLR